MVLKPEIVLERLKEMDTALEELSLYQRKSPEDFKTSLSLRWTVERGLIALANFVFDVADHILSGYFGVYSDTYEETLQQLQDKGVISEDLYRRIKGLGGFRNILVHDYLKVDLKEVHRNLLKSFEVFSAFSSEIQQWLETVA
jgi:uncharacterized protein YutE (UPF0331/DUF86 family)